MFLLRCVLKNHVLKLLFYALYEDDVFWGGLLLRAITLPTLSFLKNLRKRLQALCALHKPVLQVIVWPTGRML